MSSKDRDFPAPRGEPGDEPTPSLLSFLEYSPLRLGGEALLGAVAGGLLAGAAEAGAWVLFAVAGAVGAPLALMLTPVHGSPWMRGLRYGIALSALLTLGVSLAGPGRDRPVAELLVLGAFLLAVGTVGHGILAATVGRGSDADPSS
jgi:hypothetical protein